MPRKKLYERKISDIRHEVRLFEITDSYVKNKAKLEGKKQNEIIRELCEYARLEELTKGQFSVGTTKVFQSVQNNLIKKNVVDPIEVLTQEIKDLKEKITEMEFNERFMQEEIFKIQRVFFVENQMIVDLIYKDRNRSKEELNNERKRIFNLVESQFETRKDAFFVKYKALQNAVEQKKSLENSSDLESDLIN